METISEGIQIVGSIAIFLAGAFPMVLFNSKTLKKPLDKLGTLLGISNTSTSGLIASLAHTIPMLILLEYMGTKRKNY